ncbi:sigma-E factor negative regulatory protein RseB [Nitrosomonas sp. Nm51]|uniref:MucB/RseB C-terminal domain-containing protein n=1 Tax=Nitrosomonas sp. Nm51 TaxID=133720 RepID=UPI0008B9DFBF|nr:MucB/RseB C-terminal domain-containing protein [Nitrosomonas sp. Nm51]SER08848.1 sigma-E factor negative regulatory protein RseB [Nitrosomonas sp. Nm51]
MKYPALPAFSLLFVLAFQAVYAENQSQSNKYAHDWLQRIADAPRQLNYQGTFVYYADDHIETSQVTHRVDHDDEYEKIEVLDGKSRIVYRNNDEMKCYMPDSKKIYTEKRWHRKFFPDLLPQPTARIYENYKIEVDKQERIAGHDAQLIKLIPNDNLRYGHKFWVDIDSGLLLKAAVVDKKDIVEQFAFAQLKIGGNIDENLLNPELMTATNWKKVDLTTEVLTEGELKWKLKKLPAGFKKITEMRRKPVGKSSMVDHIVLSDDLASVSVFVEPIKADASPTVTGFYSSRGAINIYVREFNNNKITTVGEVPLNTIKLIGDAVFVK